MDRELERLEELEAAIRLADRLLGVIETARIEPERDAKLSKEAGQMPSKRKERKPPARDG